VSENTQFVYFDGSWQFADFFSTVALDRRNLEKLVAIDHHFGLASGPVPSRRQVVKELLSISPQNDRP
jgi:hypothetical protein